MHCCRHVQFENLNLPPTLAKIIVRFSAFERVLGCSEQRLGRANC